MLAELVTLVMPVALLITKPHIALLLSVAVALQGLEELLGHVLLYLLPISWMYSPLFFLVPQVSGDVKRCARHHIRVFSRLDWVHIDGCLMKAVLRPVIGIIGAK